VTTRLSEIVVDCIEPIPLARWWRETLCWDAVSPEPGERMLRAPPDDTTTPALLFLTVAEPKRGKNRVHLDLASESLDEQAATVDSLIARGATRVDVGQTGVPWTVLADPEGNEFCVLEPRDVYRGVGRLAGITIDSTDPNATARFWADATGWAIGEEHDGAVTLVPPGRRVPDLVLVSVDEPKAAKLRWHLDVEPIGGTSVEAEAQRLRDLGAIDLDIGQHADPTTDWIVLADPEGNELCVIPPL
jgi:catechol 2,3-dioxygenase-like lactoylglutathione lyase family enzyme